MEAGSTAKVDEMRQELHENIEQLKTLELKVAKLKTEKVRLSKTISYLKKKCDKRDSHFLELRKSNNKEIESLENKVLQ